MAFVVTRGELAAVDRPVGRPPMALSLTPTVQAEYAHLWRTQPAIRTVVTFLARNVAGLPLKVYRRHGDTDREHLPPTRHPLAALLREPTPGRGQFALFNTVMHDLGIYDRCYLIKVRGTQNRPRALLRAHPRQMEVTGDSAFEVGGYLLRGSRGSREFAPPEVVHFHGYNPDDSRDGCSPMEALRRMLLEEHYAGTYREQLWRNGARVSGYLKRPLDAPAWDKVPPGGGESPRDRFRRDWRAQYSGDGPQAGGTPILEDGMEFVSASVTPEQAQALESRKLSREEVAAAYFIPPPMIGILDHATFSNIREQHKHLYQDTLGPWLAMLEETLDLQLVPDYGSPQLYVEFNLAQKLAGSFEERAGVLQSAVGAPYLTRNEARAMDNRAPVDGGDDLITPLNVLIGGQASPRDSAPPPQPGEAARRVIEVKARAPRSHVDRAERLLAATFDRQARVVVARIAAEQAADDDGKAAGRKWSVADVFDRGRWDLELAADLFGLNTAVAAVAVASAVAQLGWDLERYDEGRTMGFLQANAERVAAAINGRTAEHLAAALARAAAGRLAEAAAELFETYKANRAGEIARAQVTSISGFGTTEAARQRLEAEPDADLEAVKTWRVTSSRPRASHAALDGITVPIDQRFPNGAEWPGDPSLPDDERAGCQCDVTVEVRG